MKDNTLTNSNELSTTATSPLTHEQLASVTGGDTGPGAQRPPSPHDRIFFGSGYGKPCDHIEQENRNFVCPWLDKNNIPEQRLLRWWETRGRPQWGPHADAPWLKQR